MSVAELAVGGKWELESSENFDEYMKALGVGLATRLIVTKLKPSQEYIINGDEWVIKTCSTFKNMELKFKPGETFEETTPDGRKVQSTISVEGNKLTHEQKGTIDTCTVREFTKDTIIMKMMCKDVVCTRVYKRPA